MSNDKARVYVFNGPPESGKDDAADLLMAKLRERGEMNLQRREFKTPMFRMAAAYLHITLDAFMDGYYDKVKDRPMEDKAFVMDTIGFGSETGEMAWKDVPIYEVACYDTATRTRMSKRQVLIHISEEVIKPNFGDNAFGIIMRESIGEEGLYFVSDSGFPEELSPTIEKVGSANVTVIRIHRPGKTYVGDSRDYLEPHMFDNQVRFVDLHNDGILKEYHAKLEKFYNAEF